MGATIIHVNSTIPCAQTSKYAKLKWQNKIPYGSYNIQRGTALTADTEGHPEKHGLQASLNYYIGIIEIIYFFPIF